MNRIRLAAFAALAILFQGGVVNAAPLVASSTAYYERVQAHDSDIWTFTLRTGERIDFCLSGDGDTCLELRAFEVNGRLIAQDTAGWGDDRHIWVRAYRPTTIKVVVRNLGSVYNDYVLSAH